jgi:hypothetical protein
LLEYRSSNAMLARAQRLDAIGIAMLGDGFRATVPDGPVVDVAFEEGAPVRRKAL